MTSPESHLPVVSMQSRGILQGLAGFLDWTLAAALGGALPLAVYGTLRVHQEGAPWSRWALLFGSVGAFVGAAFGAISWAAWTGTRKKGLVFGVIAGTVTGVLASSFFWAAYEPLRRGLAGVTENILRTMLDGLIDWYSTWLPAVTFFALGAASVIAYAARITDRSRSRGPGAANTRQPPCGR